MQHLGEKHDHQSWNEAILNRKMIKTLDLSEKTA
jgi:hypothetical protein